MSGGRYPIWQVTLRSSEMGSHKELYASLTFQTFYDPVCSVYARGLRETGSVHDSAEVVEILDNKTKFSSGIIVMQLPRRPSDLNLTDTIVREYVFLRFFKIQKNVTFYVFLKCHVKKNIKT